NGSSSRPWNVRAFPCDLGHAGVLEDPAARLDCEPREREQVLAHVELGLLFEHDRARGGKRDRIHVPALDRQTSPARSGLLSLEKLDLVLGLSNDIVGSRFQVTINVVSPAEGPDERDT